MGSQQSINETPLGKSLIGKQFCTKNNTCFGYCSHDKTYVLTKWEDFGSWVKKDHFRVNVNCEINFQIVDVIKTWSMSHGYDITLKITFLNNIQLKNIINCEEFDGECLLTNRPNINDITSNKLPIINNDSLRIFGTLGIIYYFDFGFGFPKLSKFDIDTNQSYLLEGDDIIVL